MSDIKTIPAEAIRGKRASNLIPIDDLFTIDHYELDVALKDCMVERTKEELKDLLGGEFEIVGEANEWIKVR